MHDVHLAARSLRRRPGFAAAAIATLALGIGASTGMAGVSTVVQSAEPETRIEQLATLDALVARATAQPRFTSRLVAAFGALALILAAVGIYGTLSYVVSARTREIGIRLALGAPRAAIVSDLMWRGFAPAAAGGAIGLAVAAALARTVPRAAVRD
jgi:ABC-type antimicrobial peptide transport system permease subunit